MTGRTGHLLKIFVLKKGGHWLPLKMRWNKVAYSEVQINEEEIGKLPEKEFRIMTLKMIKNVENKMEETQESSVERYTPLKTKT